MITIVDNPIYKPRTIDNIVIDKDCVECSGRDFNCSHIFMCDYDKRCIFRSMYEDLFKGDKRGN